MQKMTTQKLCVLAVLCAMQVVLSRIAAINVGNYLKISFGFIPIAVCGILAGPLWAALVATAADVIGALLFPTGAFFPGYTVVATVGGLRYGLFLYRSQSFPRILGAVAVHQLVLSLLLNTLWISLLYGSPFVPLLVSRLPQCAILAAVQLVVIPLIARLLPRIRGGAA